MKKIPNAILKLQKRMTSGPQQKFHYGDIIYKLNVIDDCGFPPQKVWHAGDFGVIVGSYADQYGGSDRTQYTVDFGGGRTSWHQEKHMVLSQKA